MVANSASGGDKKKQRSTLHRLPKHAFDAAAANVTHGEHARSEFRGSWGERVERPSGRGEIFLGQVHPVFDETFRIERDTAIQPSGVRFVPGHQEYVL